jgi:methionine aminotransferase
VFSADHAVQKALASYLKEPQHYLGLNQFYQEKRDLFLKGISTSRFKIKPSKGTYFQLVDYNNITQEPDEVFAERLVTKHQIASIPISGFNTKGIDKHLLRFCFAKTNETLERATEILSKI